MPCEPISLSNPSPQNFRTAKKASSKDTFSQLTEKGCLENAWQASFLVA